MISTLRLTAAVRTPSDGRAALAALPPEVQWKASAGLGNRDLVTGSVSAAVAAHGVGSLKVAMIAHALRDIGLS
jgi:hypothetical protein